MADADDPPDEHPKDNHIIAYKAQSSKNLFKIKQLRVIPETVQLRNLKTLQEECKVFHLQYKSLFTRKTHALSALINLNKLKASFKILQTNYDELVVKLENDGENKELCYEFMLCEYDNSFEEKENNYKDEIETLKSTLELEILAVKSTRKKELLTLSNQFTDVLIRNNALKCQNITLLARISALTSTAESSAKLALERKRDLTYYDTKIKAVREKLLQIRSRVDKYKALA